MFLSFIAIMYKIILHFVRFRKTQMDDSAIQCGKPERTAVVDCDPYYKYSVMYHLAGLPPLCLLHGNADELSPYSQSVELAKALDRRGNPHEFYGYEGLSHYFVQTAADATTMQMFRDSLDCLRRGLEDTLTVP